ncbi:HK97 gp10 family phage protein [Niallia alba]|uniref:HK97 gp10 family phage protein n=1 Tax=Niallia alba TaxID=2729105 RepID=UPI002E1DCBB1|nr:HK97 gp10 family phage protein [Niallia alba]
MAANNNGFAQALEDINTIVRTNQTVSKTNLEKAADYFVSKLEDKIPKSIKNKKHLRDSLKVVIKEDIVSVQFESDSFYWYMVEHGHKKANGKGRVKGTHFVRNTTDQEQQKLLDMMMDRL